MSYVESRSGLLIPKKPMNRCRICGDGFPIEKDRAFVDHVKFCSEEHADELNAEMEAYQAPIWDHDEEKYEWVKSGRKL